MAESWRSVAAALVVFVVLAVGSSAAHAHTDFASSTPADMAILGEAVYEISLVFTAEATPAGEGFVVRDPSGVVRVPDSVTSSDNLTWILEFDEPLAGGAVGVRWTVQAPDTHPIDGSFSFTVDVDPAETATSSEQAAVSTSVAVSNQPDDDVVDQGPSSTSLGDFLDTGRATAQGASLLQAAGRVVSLAGAMVGIGGLVFVAFVLRGDPAEIRSVLFWVRRAGVLLVLGATAEVVAQVAVTGGRWSGLWSLSAMGDVLSGSFGLAIGLRVAGGAMLALGVQLTITRASVVADPVVAIKEYARVGAGSSTTMATHTGDDSAWQVEAGTGAFIGAALVLGSFLFDGHTVTEGDRWLHAVANSVHVAAAAVWAGGIFMLVHVLWRRHRKGVEPQGLRLAVRFSVVAVFALVAAGAAGLALAIIILDNVADVWSTPWGRLLIAKVVLVSIAAAAGAYNHRVLIPSMTADPGAAADEVRFRKVVVAEALALAMAVVTTGFLVAAAS